MSVHRAKRSSKYGNKKTVVDGITFDSKKEAARYQELKLMEKSGLILGLDLQTPYPIYVKGKKICTYKADFTYCVKGVSEVVVEDVKGVRTPLYRLKKKLVEALHDVTITEV